MRLTSSLLRRVGEWSKKYANLPDRYIERAMAQVYIIIKLFKKCVMFCFIIFNSILLTVFYFSFYQSIFNTHYLLINSIRFIGGHLEANRIICHARLKENDFIFLCIVLGQIIFIAIMHLVKTIHLFMSNLLRTGASFGVTGYVNYRI